MATATEEPQFVPVTENGKVESRFDFLPLPKLFESPSNPRKEFGDLTDLSASIRAQGVLEPLIVRKGENGKAGEYEVVCGARRLRAMLAIGFEFAPCVVRTLTDEQTLEAQISENSLRLDPHPMEEAEAYERLLKTHKIEVVEIAAKVGRSKSFVYQRIKLLDLCPEGRKAFLAGKLATVTALHVARLPKVTQKKAVEEVSQRGWSQESAIDHIKRQFMLRLAEASFDRTSVALVPKAGPCTTCPKRTGNQRELFPDVKADDADTCTDAACFKGKADSAWMLMQAEAKGKGWQVLADSEAVRHVSAGYLSSNEYVSMGAPCTLDPKQRPWVDLLKSQALPVFVARDQRGTIYKLFRRKDAQKALVLAGHDFAVKRPAAQRTLDTEGQKVKEKVDLRKGAVAALRATIGTAITNKKGALPQAAIDVMVRAMLAGGGSIAVGERWARKLGKPLKGFEACEYVSKHVGEMEHYEVPVLLFDLACGTRFDVVDSVGYSNVAKAAAKAFGIEMKDMEAEARKAKKELVEHEAASRSRARGRLKESLRAEKLAAKA